MPPLLRNQQYAMLFSLYSPTWADPEEYNNFYPDLHCFQWGIPADNKVLILGDLNTREDQA